MQIAGADDADVKEQRLHDFAHGKIQVLVSKPSICGFGLNWQHCARMAFVGVTDSFEAYYQAVRRCWRFGQQRPVDVHVFASQQEGAVVANLRREGIGRAGDGRRDGRRNARSGARKHPRAHQGHQPYHATAHARAELFEAA